MKKYKKTGYYSDGTFFNNGLDEYGEKYPPNQQHKIKEQYANRAKKENKKGFFNFF